MPFNNPEGRLMRSVFYPWLKLDLREAEFTRRGFMCSKPAVQKRLEQIGRIFLEGYNLGLREEPQEQMAAQLDEVQAEYRGFAYEGAAMALALLDGITPWRKRFVRFLTGAGRLHAYMLYVGSGWARARIPWLRRKIESPSPGSHPVLRSLAIDGYGFHEGYFHWRSRLERKAAALSLEGRHIFYQGLGRSLWFVKGADAFEIARSIASFPGQYHADAWSGVGLACAYAGGTNSAEMKELYDCAAGSAISLAQGAAFAAKVRHLAGNPAGHTEIACRIFCRISAEKAAALSDEAFDQIETHALWAYQRWRELLQERLQAIGNKLDEADNPELTRQSGGECHV
jgi:enediyne biosynthesis protein E3